MAEGQKEIYFLGGADRQAIEKNPALEIFRKKDYEVLYLTDPLDEFVLDHLHEYDKKPFKMAESADIPLEEKTEAADERVCKGRRQPHHLPENHLRRAGPGREDLQAPDRQPLPFAQPGRRPVGADGEDHEDGQQGLSALQARPGDQPRPSPDQKNGGPAQK